MAIEIESFGALTAKKAQDILVAESSPDELSLLKFYQGDHWQDGEGWVGPLVEGEGNAATESKKEIERSFIFSNVCREIANRHANAVIAREPHWGATLDRVLEENEKPSGSETTLISEMNAMMGAWWDFGSRCTYTAPDGRLKTCNAYKLLKRAARRYAATGRVNLRLFIPPGRLNEQGVLPKVPLADSLNRVFVEMCEIGTACVHTDRQQMQQIGVYVWNDGKDDHVELSYLDDNRQTALREAKAENADAGTLIPVFDLSGQLLHFEINGDAILTPSVISQQKDLNRTLSMGGRNMNLAGFPERTLLDVQLSGRFVDDPEAPKGKRFVPDPPEIGAGTVNNFVGIEYEDEERRKRRTTPSYQRHDPTGNHTFIESVDAAKRSIRDEAVQSHVEMASDATASGRSREQARYEFTQSLIDTVIDIESLGHWMLGTAFALARATSSESGNRFDALHFDFVCRINAGPVSASERAEDREQVAVGILSRETAMVRGGVDDIDAENTRIAAEEEGSRSERQARAAELAVLTGAGAGIGEAAQVAGFSEEDVALLVRGDFVDLTAAVRERRHG